MRQSLGDFEVLERIGEGGSAVVYRARNRTLGGELALKKWRTTLTTAQRKDFLTECELQWKLSDHDNIVRLYWAEAPAEGPAWMATELYLESLADRLRSDRPLSLDEALNLVDDLLAGLAAVHAEGHVHRDVKPANVLLKDGRAALGDLGIAIRADTRTTDGAAGTDRYTAPELGSGGIPNFRADVYSAAVTIRATLGNDLPDRLDDLLTRAASYDPADRPADASELRRQIRAFRGLPAAAPTGAPEARPAAWRRPPRAWRRVVTVAAVAVAMVGTGTAAVLARNNSLEQAGDPLPLTVAPSGSSLAPPTTAPRPSASSAPTTVTTPARPTETNQETASTTPAAPGPAEELYYVGRAADGRGNGIAGLWVFEGDFLDPDPETTLIDGSVGTLLTRTGPDGSFRIRCPGTKRILITSMSKRTIPADPNLNWAWNLARGTGAAGSPCRTGSSAPVVTTMAPGAILKGRYIWDPANPGKVDSGDAGFSVALPLSEYSAFQVPIVRSTYLYTGLRTGTYKLSDTAGGSGEVRLTAGRTTTQDWYAGSGLEPPP